MDTPLGELFSVAGKIALVSGGSDGIGKFIAGGLVAAGVRTYIVARNSERCAAVALELSKFGSCTALCSDLSTTAGIKAAIKAFHAHERELHILVNNAGKLWEQPIDEFTEEGWDSVLDLNLKTVFFLTQGLLPALRNTATAEDPARVINIGSADGINVSDHDHYSYLASKAGAHHLTRGLAKRLARENITVNVIAPGPFPSNMTAGHPEEVIQAVANMIPRGRFGTEEDIVGTVIFLASRAGAYITAAVIPLEGGLTGTK